MVVFDADIWLFVRKSLRYILFVFTVSRELEAGLVFCIIISQHFQEGIFTSNTFITVVYIVIKYSNNIH